MVITSYSAFQKGVIMKTQIFAIVCVCGLLLVTARADSSSASQSGRYQLVADAQNMNVWRVDTATGQVVYCVAITEVHTLPDCYTARILDKSKTPYDSSPN